MWSITAGADGSAPRPDARVLRAGELWRVGAAMAALARHDRAVALARPRRRPVHVAVLHLDEVPLVVAEAVAERLGDRDGAMPAARAADRDEQVRLPLADVLRQQVVQQRHDAVVELGQPPVARDVV